MSLKWALSPPLLVAGDWTVGPHATTAVTKTPQFPPLTPQPPAASRWVPRAVSAFERSAFLGRQCRAPLSHRAAPPPARPSRAPVGSAGRRQLGATPRVPRAPTEGALVVTWWPPAVRCVCVRRPRDRRGRVRAAPDGRGLSVFVPRPRGSGDGMFCQSQGRPVRDTFGDVSPVAGRSR